MKVFDNFAGCIIVGGIVKGYTSELPVPSGDENTRGG
jgi:hypothetical protein